MSLYAIDPLHPDRLRCELCGATVAALPDDGETPEGELSAAQVAHAWPGLAGEVAEHEGACPAAVRVRLAE